MTDLRPSVTLTVDYDRVDRVPAGSSVLLPAKTYGLDGSAPAVLYLVVGSEVTVFLPGKDVVYLRLSGETVESVHD